MNALPPGELFVNLGSVLGICMAILAVYAAIILIVIPRPKYEKGGESENEKTL